jgi:hypothetical protein
MYLLLTLNRWKLDIVYINTEDNCVVLVTVHESGSEELVQVSVNRKYYYDSLMMMIWALVMCPL